MLFLESPPPRGFVFRPSFRSWRLARGPGQPKGALRGEEPSVKYPTLVEKERSEEEAMMDRGRPSTSDSEEKIPEAWIGQEVMIETTEALSSDLRASAPV